MDFIEVFKLIVAGFKQENIDFAIIGGFALQFSGITRATRDIDLLVLVQDRAKVRTILLAAGYKLIHESSDVLNFISDNTKLGRIDFLLAHRKYTLAMLQRAQEKEIFGGKFKVKVITAEDQIGLKVQSSSNDPQRLSQDMADIEALIRNNHPHLDLALLKEYFNLFDRSRELEEILKRLERC